MTTAPESPGAAVEGPDAPYSRPLGIPGPTLARFTVLAAAFLYQT